MVADDDIDFARVLRDCLEVEGFETLVAHEGVRTIESAHKKKPDLIILDLRMPAGSGQTVLRQLRSHPETERIPVLVLTAVSLTTKMEKEFQDGGAQQVLKKPCEIRVLMKAVHALLPH